MECLNDVINDMILLNITPTYEDIKEMWDKLNEKEKNELELGIHSFNTTFYQLKYGLIRKDKNGDLVFICSPDEFIIHNPTETERGEFLFREFEWKYSTENPTTEDFYNCDKMKFYAAYLPDGENDKTPDDPAETAIYKMCCYLESKYGFARVVKYPITVYLYTHASEYFKYNRVILPNPRPRANSINN